MTGGASRAMWRRPAVWLPAPCRPPSMSLCGRPRTRAGCASGRGRRVTTVGAAPARRRATTSVALALLMAALGMVEFMCLSMLLPGGGCREPAQSTWG